LREAIQGLPPGYFALVMATGIVSLAAHFLHHDAVSVALFWINVIAYGALWLLTLARLALHGREVGRDLADHARGPGFFTLPAGTCVLGAQFAILRAQPVVATRLWFVGIVLWAVVTYGFLAAVTVKQVKPPFGEGLNGTWLIAVVATQSIAVLGCLVAPSFAAPGRVLFVAVGMHMAGFMLYLPLIALLLYRWMFFELTPQQLTPPYWINMGALAISTLAGARLLQSSAGSPLLQRITPFLEGATLFYWTAATWWIPLLVVLGVWRHVIRRVPIRYDPQYWGMVFPLGMYTTCTVQAARALDLPGLEVVARAFVWPALIAWTATFVGLLLSLARAASRRS
jgi:tellurite resistance protein TehA-like permease